MCFMTEVRLEKVRKQLKRLPESVRNRLLVWVKSVESIGVRATRRLRSRGLHDEPLKGKRIGQRSIRLSKSWRAIYREEKEGIIHIIIVLEVNKHDY